ncbi:hypothetical protein Ahy_B06g082078 [Arachis hypogaea]|uniref:Replication factor A C-terminal domain-containing protein n=1 Tax=Arachis hypogaea TaxID=3818 RepID=A0A444YMP0_ARAHY|nr:hypothetical protein Ahy_B06g082078 [Arachis hypogaea]
MAGTVDLITDINGTKLSWSLVTGVARLYEFPSQWNEKEVFSLEMVLQDVKGDRIHSTISKLVLEALRHQIKEHAIYSMQNFVVTTNNGKSAYYVSKVYFNPNLTEVNEFKERLNKAIVSSSQQITQLQTQHQYSATDEINAGIGPLKTIEEICPKKVVESKDRYWCDHCRRVDFKAMLRYRLQLIVTDRTGCVKLNVWNKEAEQMKWKKTNAYPKHLDNVIDKRFLFKLTITYKNINAIEGIYSVTKLSDDDFLISSFGCASSPVEASNFQMMGNTPITETEDDSNAHDSTVESNGNNSYQTPAKRSSPDTFDGYIGEAIVFADAQASANKTFKQNSGKKKIE